MCQRWPWVSVFLTSRSERAVYESFFVQADEDFADGAGEAGIEGEALAAPVAACAQADHLALDAIAVLRLPFPDALDEFVASQGAAVEPFFGEFAFDDHLGSDAGVVGAGQPEGVVAAHAMPADGDVDFGMLQHVADVERAGNVGRRNDEGKDARLHLFRGVEDTGVNPPLGPVRFEALGLVDLLDWHGSTMISRCVDTATCITGDRRARAGSKAGCGQDWPPSKRPNFRDRPGGLSY